MLPAIYFQLNIFYVSNSHKNSISMLRSMVAKVTTNEDLVKLSEVYFLLVSLDAERFYCRFTFWPNCSLRVALMQCVIQIRQTINEKIGDKILFFMEVFFLFFSFLFFSFLFFFFFFFFFFSLWVLLFISFLIYYQQCQYFLNIYFLGMGKVESSRLLWTVRNDTWFWIVLFGIKNL